VEYVGRISPVDWISQLVLKLPDEVTNAGDMWVSITLHGATSNKVMVKLKH